MQALQQAVVEQRARNRLSSASVLGVRGTEQPDRAGSLELRGFKNKLYVAVVGDKVQLYKNLEVQRALPGLELSLSHTLPVCFPVPLLSTWSLPGPV